MEDLTESPPAGELEWTPPPGGHAARVEKFVSFRLGAGSYAILAAAVAEVIHPLPFTPLPGMPPDLLGISPLRGEILAALNIRRILGEPAVGAPEPKSKQIVMKRSGGDAAPIAFTVDRVGEIVAIDVSQIRTASEARGFLIGETEIDDRVIKVIDHSKLASAAEPDLPAPPF